MPREDFVNVQLSSAGLKLAGDGPLHIGNARRNYTFTAGTPIEAERSYEWNVWLSKAVTNAGESLFELVPAPAASRETQPAGSTGPKPAPVAAPTPQSANTVQEQV